jgi:hypothetical protein
MWVEKIKLKGVGPPRIVRILPVRGDGTVWELRPAIGSLKEISVGSSYEKVRTLIDPTVIKADMVRNEIEEESYPSLFKAITKMGELLVTTYRWVCDIFTHREG